MLISLALLLAVQNDSVFAEVRRPVETFPGFGRLIDVAFGDVDGDGDDDVYLVYRDQLTSTDEALLLENDGSGTFTDVSSKLAGAVVGRRPRFADLDGDLDLDLVLSSSSASVLLNDGTGVFVDGLTSIPADSFAASQVADFDGDGDLDVLRTTFSSMSLYLNDGNAVFTDGSSGLPAGTIATTTWAGDIDGDTDVDLLVRTSCTSIGNAVTLWTNDGNAVFSDASSQLGLDRESIDRAELVDVDGDGSLDAVLLTRDCTGVGPASLVMRNDGSGNFTHISGALPISLYLRSTAFGDADGDGDIDLWVGNSFGQDELLLNDGTGVFSDGTSALPQLPDPTRLGVFRDLDGDGDEDLWTNTLHDTRILFSDGAGNFANSARNWVGSFAQAAGFAVGDANGDGHLDLLTLRTDASFLNTILYEHALFLGDGTGDFTEAVGALPPRDFDGMTAEFGDVDGDGDLDIVAGQLFDGDFHHDPGPGNPPEITLWLNDGSGNYSDASSQVPTSMFPDRGIQAHVELADVDGDGDLDVVHADMDDYDGGHTGLGLWKNDGAGNFTDATPSSGFPPFVSEALDLRTFDAEGDGDVDVLFYGVNTGLSLYINDGSGSFTDETALRTPPPPLLSQGNGGVAAADFDGDGVDDIVVFDSASPTFQVSVLSNDGAGFFSTTSTIATNFSRSFAVGDFDGDGDPDVILTDQHLVNDGTGVLSDSGLELPGRPGWYIDHHDDFWTLAHPLVVDLDRDGDDDVITARGSGFETEVLSQRSDSIWLGQGRQLSHRTLPRVGKPLALDMRGPANGIAVLFAGTTLLPDPVPTIYGNVFATGTFLSRVRLFDADGKASFEVAQVPNDPSLVGVEIYWQALVDAPTHFTNFERTLLTEF